MVIIESKPIGAGKERVAYIHPHDEDKIIKIVKPNCKNKQTKRDIKYYRQLAQRKNMNWSHIPFFYGEIETNKGKGIVFDLIRDYNGEVSKPFEFYIEKNGIALYKDALVALKNYFLDEVIVFNGDIRFPNNLLLKKIDETHEKLILIDGVGDHVLIPFPSSFHCFLRKKILRRWERFEKELASR